MSNKVNRRFRLVSFCVLFSITVIMTRLSAFAQVVPAITGGPVNAASYTLKGLPSSGTAQGSMFILFGTNMGPSSLLQVSAFPLPSNLGGTSISATVGGTTVNAIMLYTSSFQVAAILPSNTPLGDGTVRLTFNGQTSNSVPVRVVAASFGSFARNQAGSGPGIVFNFISQTNQPVNSLIQAAQPGQIGTLWGTGLGPVSGNEAGGPLPGNLPISVEVFVGGQLASISYAGRSGCCAGIDQIIFTVPPGVTGCYVPVAVRIAGVMSNFTTIAINPEGQVCSDPIFFSASDLSTIQARIQSGGTVNTAIVNLTRFGAKFSLTGQGTLEGNADFGDGQFTRYNARDLLNSAGFGVVSGLPSVGSCNVSQFTYEEFFGSIAQEGNDPTPHSGLDAGAALTVSGPRGTKQIPKEDCPGCVGSYNAEFGGTLPGIIEPPEFLDPGTYTINNGSGGSAVGAFSTTLTLPSNLLWSNRDAITTIPRSQDLTVTWSGADGSQEGVFIIGSSANTTDKAGAAFLCSAQASAGSFTVPSWVLSALPASGQAEEGPVGFLLVAKAPLRQATTFQAPGIDIGIRQYTLIQLRNVNYQ